MKILLVTGSLPPMKCGVGAYSLRLAVALSRVEHLEVGILTDVRASSCSIEKAFELFPFVSGKTSDINRVRAVFRDWKPNIIHFQFPTMGYNDWGRLPHILPLIAWLNNTPIILTWHELVRFSTNSSIVAMLLQGLLHPLLVHGLVVVRQGYLDSMPGWFRRLILGKKFRCIPNASTIPATVTDANKRDSVRKSLRIAGNSIVVFFGFAFPNKKVEQVFEIANPDRDHVVLLCDLDASFWYQNMILRIANGREWRGKVTVTGFLPAEEVAEMLASADAVVLPFEEGGGTWNTSVHAAMDQGTFVLTTSRHTYGYSSSENVYYAKPGDIADMKSALSTYRGRRVERDSVAINNRWNTIATEHVDFYRVCLEGR